MRVYRAKDYKDMSRKAANIISAQIILKPNSVLGLATGSTPIPRKFSTSEIRLKNMWKFGKRQMATEKC